MSSSFIDIVSNPRFLLQLAILIAGLATIMTLIAQQRSDNALETRMKAVAIEREQLRSRARSAYQTPVGALNLRQAPKPFMKRIVERFNLSEWLSAENSKLALARAGFRGQQAEIAFLFFRLVMPPAFALVAAFYVFVIEVVQVTLLIGLCIVLAACFLGLKAPEIFLSNAAQKRQDSIRSAFPDAMDLLLICVESGISIESAMQRVATEVGQQSVPLAEEMSLTMAELSYLSSRHRAYENFAERTNLEIVRQIVLVLVQAERVGTPLADALRVVSLEARTRRLLAAEEKAASLPPKLTLPMMVFFLPCIFALVLSPAIISVYAAAAK